MAKVCGNPTEVSVCQHVDAGQAFDFLASTDGLVDSAFCAECSALVDEHLERYGDAPEQVYADAFERLKDYCGFQNICRECARELGIPDATPNGERFWFRPVQ